MTQEYKETESGLLVPRTEIDNYFTHHYAEYQAPDSRGYTVLEVLEFLKDQPLDDMALDFIHSLRPSGIRITEGYVTCDARLWRVTVYIEYDMIIPMIKKIEQEVEIGLRTAGNGHELGNNFRRRNER